MKQKIYYSLLILFILLAVALFLRTLNLHKEFSGDESAITYLSQLTSVSEIVSNLKQKYVYPPLTYILVHYWTQVNQSVLWIRLYFVLFGFGVCVLIYLLGKEYLNAKFAKITLLLAAFSPLLIFTSQYARSYGDSAFWMLLSSLFMLKIVKGKDRLEVWIGYVVSTVLSLYTFYFSALLIFTQFIYMVIFKSKDRKCILKWCLSMFMIGLIFMPWLPSAFRQFNNASSIVYDWSDKGFNLGVLRFGLYTRNIFSLIGFDPYFMLFRGGITTHFTTPILITGIFLVFTILLLFLFYCFKYLRTKFSKPKDRPLVWFPFFLVFMPLVLSWVSAGLLNTLPNARYLIVQHAFFLMLISIFIYSLWKKKRLVGGFFIVLLLGIFVARIPSTRSPDFDAKSATSFIKENSTKDDCLICISSCPNNVAITNIIIIEDKYIKLNERKSEYIPISTQVWQEIKKKLRPFNSVWFCRVHGHNELFGANLQIDNFLKNEGYKMKRKGQFHGIDAVKYEK